MDGLAREQIRHILALQEEVAIASAERGCYADTST
jgi:hypothetical protein